LGEQLLSINWIECWSQHHLPQVVLTATVAADLSTEVVKLIRKAFTQKRVKGHISYHAGVLQDMPIATSDVILISLSKPLLLCCVPHN